MAPGELGDDPLLPPGSLDPFFFFRFLFFSFSDFSFFTFKGRSDPPLMNSTNAFALSYSEPFFFCPFFLAFSSRCEALSCSAWASN